MQSQPILMVNNLKERAKFIKYFKIWILDKQTSNPGVYVWL